MVQVLKINNEFNFAGVIITSFKFDIVLNKYFTINFTFKLESSKFGRLIQYFKVNYILVKLQMAF